MYEFPGLVTCTFAAAAHRAAEEGRTAIPGLMLTARDHPSPLDRLCAICALRLMAPREPVAGIALERIGRLAPQDRVDFVWKAAQGGLEAWGRSVAIEEDPSGELRRLGVMGAFTEPPRYSQGDGSRVGGYGRPEYVPDDWREQP